MRRFLGKWGFEEPRILRGFSTQGFVARQGDVVVVAFRGTEPINADDWLSNVKCHQRAMENVPGLLHGGFANGLDEISKEMLPAVEEIAKGEKTRLFLTGHSLGGALAVLAAALLHFRPGQRIAGVLASDSATSDNCASSSAMVP